MTDGGWVDMAANAPIMDTARAHALLGWSPKKTSLESLAEMWTGLVQEGPEGLAAAETALTVIRKSASR